MTEREQPSIVLEYTFPPNPGDFGVDDLMRTLTMYYWWNDSWTEPELYLDDIIADVSPEQLQPLLDVVHSLNVCEASQNEAGCKQTAQDCFFSYLLFYETDIEIEGHDDLVEALLNWADYTYDDRIDDEKGPVRRCYERYVVEKLIEAGASDIEIGNALEVIDLEAERRELAGSERQAFYNEYRKNNGTFDEYIESVLPALLFDAETFATVRESYKDVADAELTPEKKYELIRMYIAEMADCYALLEVNYLYQEHGVVPEYIHRFS